MNRLEYLVENNSSSRVDNIYLKVKVGNYEHTSAKFSLDAGLSQVQPVIVGGHADLSDITTLTTTLEVIPNAGEKVEIIRSSTIEVNERALFLVILCFHHARSVSSSNRTVRM